MHPSAAPAPRRPRRGVRPLLPPGRRRLLLAIALLATAATSFFVFTAPLLSSKPFISLTSPSLNSSSPPSLYFKEFVRTSLSLSSRSSNLLNSTTEIAPPIKKADAKGAESSGDRPKPVETNGDRPKPVETNGDRRKPRPSWDERRVQGLTPDEALLYAKKEIETAPLVVNDTDLYAPLFRNVSAFKRSYQLMEKILKVFIYNDGQAPIFHTPELQGIYASEGWFMKSMEEDHRFAIEDPSKAHLFYLPYSSRQLENALYVPNSHNLKPLAKFLKDYVNDISSRYPFWNRTRGADHFLVACHDWGPYSTTSHEELRKNTIKALCNADSSEGIFVRGRDISLPETTIRTPSRPQRYVGSRRVSQRPILAFFAGNMHGKVRPTLIDYWGNDENEMRIYKRLPNRVSRNMSYFEHMKSSKFCICPEGYEVNSPRIVEAIYSGCVPVIIADNFVLPFEEVLDWSSFSLVVAAKDIPNLKDILLSVSLKQYVAMQAAVMRVQMHFLWHARPQKYDLFHMILHSIWLSRLNHVQTRE